MATVLVIEVPAAISPLAAYPAAPVAGGDPGLAAAFIAWLLGLIVTKLIVRLNGLIKPLQQ